MNDEIIDLTDPDCMKDVHKHTEDKQEEEREVA